METARGICCVLSLQERLQLASFFSPAIDPQWVCYSLFLQSIMPIRSEESRVIASVTDRAQSDEVRWADAVHQQSSPSMPPCETRVEDLERENIELRERIRNLEARCRDNAVDLAKTPAQAVRRLQGEIASLESRLIEQQATVLATSRKSEITLRSELDVSRHEVATLQRSLEGKDREVSRYKVELEAIICELTSLRGTPF